MQRISFAATLIVLAVLSACDAPPARSNDPKTAGTQAAAANPTGSPVTCPLCPPVSPATCSALCVEENTLLDVDSTGAASGLIRLHNRGKEPVNLALAISDFIAVSSAGVPYPLSAVRTLNSVSAAAKPVFDGTKALAADESIDIKVDASKIWQAGLSTAQLSNKGAALIEVRAVKKQVTFNVKADGPTPDQINISFTRGMAGWITLRNEDPMAYRFLWRLDVPESHYGNGAPSGVATIEPNATISLPVAPPDNFPFLETGFLRSGVRTGTLSLEYEPDPILRVLPLAKRRLPVTARLNYFGGDWQKISNYLSVLAILLFGIIISLLLNYALPTQRKRVALKQRLADLEGRLAGLADVIDSVDLSLLRVEKKRLREGLRELVPIFPTTAIELPKLETRLGWLEQRVELTVKAGELLQAMEDDSANISYIEAERIRASCNAVLEVVRGSSATDAEVAGAREQLQQAAAIVANADRDPSPEMVAELKKRAAAVSSKIPNPLPQDAPWPKFGKTIQGLQGEFPNDAAEPPKRLEFVKSAKAVRKAELILEFISLVQRAPSDEIKASRLGRADDLLAALQPGPDESLTKAAAIVGQVEQNISRKELIDEIKLGTAAMWIEIDPPTPFSYQLVTLRLRFRRPGLDCAVARKEIQPVWTIDGERLGDGTKGWKLGHFFREKRGRTVRTLQALSAWLRREKPPQDHFKVVATFADPAVALAEEVVLERTKSYVESRSILAVLALLISVVMVGLGLMAVAQEKLQSLDWISGLVVLIGLGFAADTLKNVLTRP